MARFEDLAPATLPRFVDGEGKNALAHEPLRILAIRHEPAARFGPRYVVEAAIISTGEMVSIGLADNSGRQAIFAKIDAHLIAGGEIDPVVLDWITPAEGKGNPFRAFRSATDEELAAAMLSELGRADQPEPEPDPKLRKAKG